MAFTRKFLSALGIEADKIDEIINAHTEVTDALKAERDSYKVDAEKLPSVQKELDAMKKASEEQEGKDPYKVKYEALKEEYDAYKSDQTAKETKAAKSKAYRELLKSAGVAEKRINAVLRVSDVDGIELDSDGNIKDSDKLTESIKSEWADFIVKEGAKGADTPNPPASTSTKMSREEIYAKDDKGRYKLDATQRQQALAELQASDNI